MKIDDLLDMTRVKELIEDGFIRERSHPEHPELRTMGYSEKAQWERMWSKETKACRGLIYDARTREVLARPWEKFFNHSEHLQDGMAQLDLAAPVHVSDKMDGSLGIIFPNPYSGEWEVATRGSFDSDQARKANWEFLPAVLDGWEPVEGWTYLCEIIYAENRIVIDYGQKQGLALLGAVNIDTGEIRGPEFDERWPDHRAEVFDYPTLGDALAAEPRSGAEGYVLRFEDGLMVKIKQEDYVRLHKIVTGLNDRAVWEHMSLNHGDVSGLAADVPDEFHKWLTTTAAGFDASYAAILDKALIDVEAIKQELGEPNDPAYRRAFAGLATKNERPHLMFALLDGKDVAPMIWKELRPVGVRYMNPSFNEAEA